MERFILTVSFLKLIGISHKLSNFLKAMEKQHDQELRDLRNSYQTELDETRGNYQEKIDDLTTQIALVCSYINILPNLCFYHFQG